MVIKTPKIRYTQKIDAVWISMARHFPVCSTKTYYTHRNILVHIVHTTFCVKIGGKSRIACERVVSRGQSNVGRYEYFAR